MWVLMVCVTLAKCFVVLEHWILHWTQIELGRHLCLSPTVEEKGIRNTSGS